ncbi:type VI secretion protein IcmF/TssM N-terminal domain-containing protein [Oceanospirillum sanctuarii]|uniref:type VI secretion protein IcmF/TssM N-terminal domain-containing protein n=1 Tax=Oceanospirillum sanctuarii TaxID=1434821 RepID=UPI001122B9FE|nr:type VI secretion protein IcmF/TssM N-terminal domain-containing protein [Oceanospirillum sanctuarii]
MKTFLRVLFYLLIWLVIFAVTTGLALFLGFSPQEGVIAAVGIFLLWLTYRLIKRLLIRLHAKGRIKQLIRLGRKDEAEEQLKADTSGLERRFTYAMRFLKRSPNTHASDPVYQLPWSVMLPAKSDDAERLVTAGQLVLPSGHKDIFTGDDCQTEWWLHNEGVVLQTPAGICASGGALNPEWGRLLELLASRRPAEPISHVLLTVSLADIQSKSDDELYQQGMILRERLDQVIQTLKVNAPVYLAFNDLEYFAGGRSLLKYLPEKMREQALGRHFPQDGDQLETETRVNTALDSLAEQLKQLNLELMGRGVVDDAIMMLPSELEQLRSGIRAFTKGVFQNSVFQASPNLRGVYWMGAEAGASETEGSVGAGLFVKEFFTEVLPRDRGLVNKIPAAVRAERWIRNLWFTGFASIMALLWVALIYTYTGDKGFIESLEQKFAGQIVQRSDLAGNITNGEQLVDLIQSLEQHSFFPWIDDTTSEPLFVGKLKAIYVDRVWNDLVMPVDRRIERSLNKALFDNKLPPDEAAQEIARYVGILVREINILQDFLAGKDLETLSALPPLYQAEDELLHEELAESEFDSLNSLYLQMLFWSPSTDNYEATLQRKQRLLKRILADHPDNLNWLVNWGNTAGKSNEVRLADFWQGSVPLDRSIQVAPAFTLAGKAMIDDFIEQILATDQAAEQINALIPGFQESYRKRYLDAWRQFALNFYKGTDGLSGHLDWQGAVDTQATGRNPFFNLLDRMTEELQPYENMEEKPDWLFLIFYYKQMATYAPADKTDAGGNGALAKLALKVVGKAGAAGKAVAKAGKSAMKTQKKLNKGKKGGGGSPSDEERLAVLEQAGALLGEYKQLIESIVFNSGIRSTSFTSVSGLYANPDNPAAGETALAQSYARMKTLQGMLGKRNRQNEAFWAIFAGPVQLFRDYMTQEAACELQERWENSFLAGMQGVPGYKRTGFLYAEGGHLWSFKDAQLNPYVKPKFGAGFVPVLASGKAFPLETDLLEYLARGDDFRKQQQSRYTVIIKSRPTSANPEAQYLPRRTLLEMQCELGPTQLENLNFAQDRAFVWDQTCADTTLLINIGRYTLEKRYPGPQGFARFLKDFQSGQRRFVPDDFPIMRDRLIDYKVSYIDVRYEFRGHKPVIKTLAASDLQPPRHIAACWSS